MFDVRGMRIAITGGAGYLGRQWRDSLMNAGGDVHILDFHGDTGMVDVTKPADLWRYLTLYPTPPDALICAAAIDAKPNSPECGPFEDVPLVDWQRMVEVNLTGVMISCQVIGAAMATAGRGSIILVSSMYGLVAPDHRRYQEGFFKPAAYSATKAGLLGLTRYLAGYWGPRGVRVNAVCFGAMGQPDHDPSFVASMEQAIPLGRLARLGEWNGVIQFLCSDASSYMTGAVLVVDGGYTAL